MDLVDILIYCLASLAV